jgi:hypothetical protein
VSRAVPVAVGLADLEWLTVECLTDPHGTGSLWRHVAEIVVGVDGIFHTPLQAAVGPPPPDSPVVALPAWLVTELRRMVPGQPDGVALAEVIDAHREYARSLVGEPELED